MYIFNAHTDICENIDEKRTRGQTRVISRCHVPFWKKGNITGGFYPTWINPDLDMEPEAQFRRIREHLESDLAECREDVCPVASWKEYEMALAAGKHALFRGAEGLSFLEKEPERVEELYAFGFRIASLSWNEKNGLICGSGTAPEEDTGLTDRGKVCIQAMEKCGMLVDLAHTSRQSFRDIMDAAEKPPVISHGACAAICPVPRNYTDEQIKETAARGGVIGISTYPPFVCQEPEKQTVEMLALHVLHVLEIAGEDSVGFGFDMVDYLDDFETDPTIAFELQGMKNEGEAGNLLAALRRHGCDAPLLEKICHGNFERILRQMM